MLLCVAIFGSKIYYVGEKGEKKRGGGEGERKEGEKRKVDLRGLRIASAGAVAVMRPWRPTSHHLSRFLKREKEKKGGGKKSMPGSARKSQAWRLWPRHDVAVFAINRVLPEGEGEKKKEGGGGWNKGIAADSSPVIYTGRLEFISSQKKKKKGGGGRGRKGEINSTRPFSRKEGKGRGRGGRGRDE